MIGHISIPLAFRNGGKIKTYAQNLKEWLKSIFVPFF